MDEELQDTGIEPAPAAEVTEPAPVEPEETGDQPAAEPPKKSQGVQKRLDELTREKYEARRDAEYWREMALRQPQPAQPAAPAVEAPPKQEDFPDYDDYLRASARHEVKQELARERQEAEKVQREESQRRAAMDQQTKTTEMIGKGKAAYDDFDIVAFDPKVRITEAVLAAAAESEEGHAIIYHLAKNPAEAARIAALSPVAQVREVGKLEARLTAPPVKQPSSAPAPIKPVGSNEPTNNEPDSTKNPDAWLAWERARVRKLGRRY